MPTIHLNSTPPLRTSATSMIYTYSKPTNTFLLSSILKLDWNLLKNASTCITTCQTIALLSNKCLIASKRICSMESRVVNDYTVCASIVFSDPTNARNALALDGTTLLGSKIKIQLLSMGSSLTPNLALMPPHSNVQPTEEHVLLSSIPYTRTGAQIIKLFRTESDESDPVKCFPLNTAPSSNASSSFTLMDGPELHS